MRTVRAFVQEKREFEHYNEKIDNVLKLSYKEAIARGFYWGFVSLNLYLHVLAHANVTASQILKISWNIGDINWSNVYQNNCL